MPDSSLGFGSANSSMLMSRLLESLRIVVGVEVAPCRSCAVAGELLAVIIHCFGRRVLGQTPSHTSRGLPDEGRRPVPEAYDDHHNDDRQAEDQRQERKGDEIRVNHRYVNHRYAARHRLSDGALIPSLRGNSGRWRSRATDLAEHSRCGS